MLIYGASLVAQMMKNLPSMWETWVRSLGWEDPWRRKWLPTPVFFPGEFHGQRSLAGYSLWSYKESDVTEWLTLSLFMLIYWPIDLVGRYFWLFNFLEEFVYNWYYFFLKCLVIFTVKPFKPAICFVRMFLNRNLISIIDMGLNRLTIIFINWAFMVCVCVCVCVFNCPFH